MRNRAFAVTLLLFAVGCASGNDPNAPQVPIDIEQLSGGSGAYFFAGPVAVQYRLAVANPTSEPLTLARLQLQTIGTGAYILRGTTTTLNLHLAPGETKTFDVNVWGDAPGGRVYSESPVTVRGVAYFDRPNNAHFLRLFNKIINPR